MSDDVRGLLGTENGTCYCVTEKENRTVIVVMVMAVCHCIKKDHTAGDESRGCGMYVYGRIEGW